MRAIPAQLARVPNLLASRIALGGIQSTNRELLDLQVRLATGRSFARPSENAIGASTVAVLDDAIERREQRVRNLTQAEATLASLDGALQDVVDTLQEARGIGLSQLGVGSDAATRRNQAAVVSAMLDSILTVANREQRGIHLFGGSRHAGAPFASAFGGIRYAGAGDGMQADLGLASDVRVTLGGERAFGALSGRIEGDRDLDPSLTSGTRLRDVAGANGSGVRAGAVEIEVNGATTLVDLSDADSIGDVLDRLGAAIRTLDPGADVSIDSATGDRLAVTPTAGMMLVIRDSNSTTTAGDLGLSGTYPGGVATAGRDLAPRITGFTRLDSLGGLAQPFGSIVFRNGGQVRSVDVASLATVEELQNAVASLGIGVRLEISPDGSRLHVRNELSGSALSVEDSGGSIASDLGIRSFAGSTRLADFNGGRGVRQARGHVDAATGLPDATANLDFRITLKDGRRVDVELEGATTVKEALERINGAAAALGVASSEFSARLRTDGNGIELEDLTAGATTVIEDLNGSSSATDLGIAGSTASATFAGTDRATVAVESVFTHLMALRDALEADDEDGIRFATDALEADVARATEARADVGVRSRRVADAAAREEELGIQDMSLRSSIQDLDFTEAATRFALLQQQLQAGLAGASRAVNLSLLDFLR